MAKRDPDPVVHFAAYGKTKTVCGLPVLRNGLPKTDRWVETTCGICLMEKPGSAR